MEALGIVLDTRNRRIIYNDTAACSAAQSTGPAAQLIPMEYWLPCKVESASINKQVLNTIYSNFDSEYNSDIHLCSANTMKSLIKSFKNKDLDYKTYINIAHPKEIGDSELQSHEELFSVNLNMCSKNTRKIVKKARLKVIDRISI